MVVGNVAEIIVGQRLLARFPIGVVFVVEMDGKIYLLVVLVAPHNANSVTTEFDDRGDVVAGHIVALYRQDKRFAPGLVIAR